MRESAYAQDLQMEYQAEVQRGLADRFLYFCLAVAALALLQAVTIGYADVIQPLWRMLLQGEQAGLAEQIRLPGAEQLFNVAQMFIDTAVYGTCAYLVWRGKLARINLDSLAVDLLRINGAIAMVAYAVITRAPSNPLGTVFQAHLIACIFMPWTWRRAVGSMLPLLALNALLVACFYGGWFEFKLVSQKLVSIGSSILILLPGAIAAFIKHTASVERFRTRFLEARYGQMSQELSAARTIHDSLFPTSGSTFGPLTLDFIYDPKKDIGGDFLFAHWVPAEHSAGEMPGDAASSAVEHSRAPSRGVLNVVLLDVTGHGITAALSVSRIEGELRRIYAEHPHTSPGQLLARLNKYVHLTMVEYSVYLTGVVIAADASEQTLRYASAGHPPIFIRRHSGKVEQLETIGPMLGVIAEADYPNAERASPFTPGDQILAYTDGAIEAIGSDGDLFGVAGVSRAVIAAPRPGHLAKAAMQSVNAYRDGAQTDDVLVVELRFAQRALSDPFTPASTSAVSDVAVPPSQQVPA